MLAVCRRAEYGARQHVYYQGAQLNYATERFSAGILARRV